MAQDQVEPDRGRQPAGRPGARRVRAGSGEAAYPAELRRGSRGPASPSRATGRWRKRLPAVPSSWPSSTMTTCPSRTGSGGSCSASARPEPTSCSASGGCRPSRRSRPGCAARATSARRAWAIATATGCPAWAGTYNMLASRRLLEQLAAADGPFRPEFAHCGGEDTDLFIRATAAGFRHACATNSVVERGWQADRLTLRRCPAAGLRAGRVARPSRPRPSPGRAAGRSRPVELAQARQIRARAADGRGGRAAWSTGCWP